MALATVNGIRLHYRRYGAGQPVLLITGSGAPGGVWRAHQVPALTAAGYQVITVDNRGMPPTVCPGGFTLDDMADDVACLIEVLGIEPCRVVGFSLGGIIVSEFLLRYPGRVIQAVLMATRGRTDAMRAARSAAEAELAASGLALPPRYGGIVRAMENLSPRTQDDDLRIRDWLDIFEMAPLDPGAGRDQLGLEMIGDRLEEYRKIDDECLVIGFADDRIVPPHLCREVAAHIPDCRYVEIADCGHFGYLEDPASVNDTIINFFSGRAD